MRLMVRLGTLLIRRLAPAVVCALAITACGSTRKPTATTSTSAAVPSHDSKKVEIYSSLPDSGSEAARSRQIETGIRLALAGYKAGAFKVGYQPLCDTTPPARRRSTSHAPTNRGKIGTGARTSSRTCTGNWDPNSAAGNAEKAARNPQTVAYIGDLNSGATALSLPILNQAGIVQITPGSGYVGLTNSIPIKSPKGLKVTQANEPNKYYPRGLGIGNRTLLRMIPSDLVQASAALDVLQKTGCQKFSAWVFGDDDEATSLFAAVIATASRYKMTYVSPPPLPTKGSYYTYAKGLNNPNGIHCAVMVGHVTHAAVELTTYLRTQLTPSPAIVGSSGFCNPGWVRGISKIVTKADVNNVISGLSCLTPALPVNQYEGHAKFVQLFSRAYHHPPTTYDLYGYAATEMLLRALTDSESDEDKRLGVLTNMVYDIAPNEVNTFSFYTDGNLETNNDYGVEQFKHGTPEYVEKVSINAAHLLSSG
jgi:branched-chain amino acid transport system substrate-binding protein